MINLSAFDLNLLRVFEAISRDRSVSVAADKLGLSQPAVSNALARLRHLVGDPLFVRSRQGMEPTPVAMRLGEAIHSGLNTIRAGLSVGLWFDPATSTRRFTVIMTDVGEICFLPHVLQTLARTAPGVDLAIIEFGLEGYEDLLESGRADLAIGRVKLADSFLNEPLHISSFLAVLRSDHPLLERDAHERPCITYESYMDAPHIEVMPRGASGNPVEQALARDGRTASRRVALSVPHAAVLPSIIAGTDLIATVPDRCAPALLASGGLTAVKVPFAVEQNHVRQWWHRRNDQDPGHRWLRALYVSVPNNGTQLTSLLSS